jgi:recombination protein RecA
MLETDRQRSIRQRLCRMPARPALFVSSGIPAIDALTGGYPCGYIVEIFGPAASGKTSLAYRAIAAVQRNGWAAALIDAERAFDAHYAAVCGVDLNRLVLSQPDSSEQALEITRQLSASGSVGLIAIDSAAALVPEAELQLGLATSTPGLHTAILARGLRHLAPIAARSGTCILVLNQLRAGYSTDEAPTTPGGRAIHSRAALRAELVPLATPGTAIFRVVRNRFGMPFVETDLDLRSPRSLPPNSGPPPPDPC